MLSAAGYDQVQCLAHQLVIQTWQIKVLAVLNDLLFYRMCHIPIFIRIIEIALNQLTVI